MVIGNRISRRHDRGPQPGWWHLPAPVLHPGQGDPAHGYRNATIGRMHKGLTGLLGGQGIRVVAGHGRVTDAHTIDVDGTRLTGTSLVVATGSRATTITGIPLGPRSITSDQLTRALHRRGITVLTGAELTEAKPAGTGVTVDPADGRSIAADVLLLAVGRAPRTDWIGLEDTGVELDRCFVVTDRHQRASVVGVYAIGDIVAGPQLAHRSFQHGIVVAERIADLDPAPPADHLIPRVPYSHPEVASVGLTEADGCRGQARRRQARTAAHVFGDAGEQRVPAAVAGAVRFDVHGVADIRRIRRFHVVEGRDHLA